MRRVIGSDKGRRTVVVENAFEMHFTLCADASGGAQHGRSHRAPNREQHGKQQNEPDASRLHDHQLSRPQEIPIPLVELRNRGIGCRHNNQSGPCHGDKVKRRVALGSPDRLVPFARTLEVQNQEVSTPKVMKPSIRTWACAVPLAVASPGLMAHPALLSSAPDQGVTLEASPREMLLQFTEAIEPSFSSITLVDPSGKEHQISTGHTDKQSARVVSFALPNLTAGAYRAYWSALGRDGHRVKGVVSFSVK